MEPATTLDEWGGALSGLPRPHADLHLRAPIRLARSSGAGAFLGVADDGNKYWLKVPGNPQGNQVLVNEVIVEEIGRRIGAPVRARRLVEVGSELASSWPDFPVKRFGGRHAIAHGSLHVEPSIDDDVMRYTKKGTNAQRQARLITLWDFCIGEDEQWLYDTSSSFDIWSYDHGFWFTTGQGDWNESVLTSLLHSDWSWRVMPSGIDPDELIVVAARIEALTKREILLAMSAVPVDWGTTDADLEIMGWFLHSRREAVGARARDLAHELTKIRSRKER